MGDESNSFLGSLNLGDVLNYGMRRYIDKETGVIDLNNTMPYVTRDGQVIKMETAGATEKSGTPWALIAIGGAALLAVILIASD